MKRSPSPAPAWLVADVGGTNVRFALTSPGQPQCLAPGSILALRVEAFDTPAAATRHYLEAMGVEPAGAVYAVAGPTDGVSAQLTNHRWSFSAPDLRASLGVPRVMLINDFAAVALALPALGDSDLSPLGPKAQAGRSAELRTLAVVGPGTGLGVAALTLREGRPVVMETEGGHASFAPGTAEEIEVLRQLAGRFGRVSWERVLCGSGLSNIDRALRELAGQQGAAGLAPEIVTERADARSDPFCVRAVELFCALLGAFAGDLALAFGAWDGVFVAGGLTVPLAPWLEAGEFRRRFEDKGRFSATMQRIPCALIRHPYPGLLGTACWVAADAARPARGDSPRQH
jgi:glucokinase